MSIKVCKNEKLISFEPFYGCLLNFKHKSSPLFRQLMTNYCEHVHNKFNKYTLGFFFCELLNVIICISQVTFKMIVLMILELFETYNNWK